MYVCPSAVTEINIETYLNADPTIDLNLKGVILDLFCLLLGVLVVSSRGVADIPDLIEKIV